jgi:small-conductance mechanosensitive channel
MKQTLEARISLLNKFVQENWPRMIFHLGIFLLISLFLLSVQRQGDSWLQENGSPSRFKYIYHHPFSSALLLSLIFTTYIYQNTPEFIRELNRLLFLIPLIRLLPKIIYHEMKKPFYWLAGLYVFQRLDELIIDFSLAHRLILLLITLVTFLGLFWILRPNSAVLQRRGGIWRQAMILSSRIAIILMGVSLLANIFGNLSLADLLTTATLNIGYVGVGVFAAILILESIIIISLQSQFLSNLRIIKKNSKLIQERVISLFRLLAVIIWIGFALENFRIYDPLKQFSQNFLSKSWQLGNFSFALGEIFIFIITIWLSILISRLIRFILEEDVLPRIPLPRGVPASISILTNYSILAIGFLIALTAAGIEWSKFALLAGAFGVGIGFGLQNVVNNFISGLILIFERPIKVADTVEVGQLKGIVKRIGIRSSTIRTFEGAEVIVPNGILIQSEVTNWTLSDRLRRIDVNVGVAYGTDPNKVLKILQKLAVNHPVVLENPAPMVLFQGFGESSLDFSFRVWTSDFDNWLTFSSDITLEVHNALYKAGIEIPFPQRDLHLRSVEKNIPQLLKPLPEKDNQGGKTGRSKIKG